MSHLRVADLSVRFDEVEALTECSFSVEAGEFFCIVGPTNAGKSTLLKTLAGLVRPAGGSITLNGREVTAAEPRERNVSLLFQNMALFPNLSGYDNIAFPLRTAGVDEAAIAERVRELGQTLKVSHVLQRLPRTLSGGEQQRVAIGRAIAHPADLLMLDEPLTNLDARIRIALRVEFKEIHKRTGQTILYVTHDQVEAMSLSDRIAVLHQGRFQQIGTPVEVYRRPANRFVAEFIGQPPMNILPAELGEGAGAPRLTVAGLRFELEQAPAAAAAAAALALGVRPEAVAIGTARSTSTPFEAEVARVEHLGSRSVIELRFGEFTLRAKLAADSAMQARDTAWFGFQPRVEHLLDLRSGRFIG